MGSMVRFYTWLWDWGVVCFGRNVTSACLRLCSHVEFNIEFNVEFNIEFNKCVEFNIAFNIQFMKFNIQFY